MPTLIPFYFMADRDAFFFGPTRILGEEVSFGTSVGFQDDRYVKL
jgi:hypothetical protein